MIPWIRAPSVAILVDLDANVSLLRTQPKMICCIPSCSTALFVSPSTVFPNSRAERSRDRTVRSRIRCLRMKSSPIGLAPPRTNYLQHQMCCLPKFAAALEPFSFLHVRPTRRERIVIGALVTLLVTCPLFPRRDQCSTRYCVCRNHQQIASRAPSSRPPYIGRRANPCHCIFPVTRCQPLPVNRVPGTRQVGSHSLQSMSQMVSRPDQLKKAFTNNWQRMSRL